MDTGASEADARDAHLWRSLDELLEGVAPSMEDVLEHMARLKRQASLDTMPSKVWLNVQYTILCLIIL